MKKKRNIYNVYASNILIGHCEKEDLLEEWTKNTDDYSNVEIELYE